MWTWDLDTLRPGSDTDVGLGSLKGMCVGKLFGTEPKYGR